MKRKNQFSFNIAYCGIMCALSTMVMFAGIIPSLNYIMSAIAGIIVWSVSGQINAKWALLTFATTALLSLFLVPEMEAKTFFILIFGYYPLLREWLHQGVLGGKSTSSGGSSRSSVWHFCLRFFVKMLVFNVAAVISYMIVVGIFGIGDVLDGLEDFGENAVYVFWVMGNVAFILYDFALGYVFYAFLSWVKPVINRLIR